MEEVGREGDFVKWAIITTQRTHLQPILVKSRLAFHHSHYVENLANMYDFTEYTGRDSCLIHSTTYKIFISYEVTPYLPS